MYNFLEQRKKEIENFSSFLTKQGFVPTIISEPIRKYRDNFVQKNGSKIYGSAHFGKYYRDREYGYMISVIWDEEKAVVAGFFYSEEKSNSFIGKIEEMDISYFFKSVINNGDKGFDCYLRDLRGNFIFPNSVRKISMLLGKAFCNQLG